MQAEQPIIVRAIHSKADIKAFAHFGNSLYRGNPYYIPDLEIDLIKALSESEIERTAPFPKKDASFSEKGHTLSHGGMQPFLAYKGKEIVGRIVALINARANKRWGVKVVRFGMIEFVEDERVAKALLDAVEKWGKERGMDRVWGPLGVTDFDKEGMLVEDFDRLGSMTAIYNPPYYPKCLEAIGFKKKVDWLQARITIPDALPKIFERVARFTLERFKLHIHPITAHEAIKGGMGLKVFHLFNKAYAPIFGFVSFTDEQIAKFLRYYLQVVDTRLITIVENEKNEVVGCVISMVSLSHALQKSGGKLLPWGWFHLLRSLKWHHEEIAEALLIGIDPEYQGLGVNAILFYEQLKNWQHLGLKYAETGPQLEDNIKELSQWEHLGAEFIKRRRCFEKEIE